MHWMGSIWMRPNGGLSSSGTQNMQSSTGQYSTEAGDPAQPVQHSVMTASSFGFFLRAVEIPLERGSCLSSSGTIPGALTTCGSAGIEWDFTSNVKLCNRDSRRPPAPRLHSRRPPCTRQSPPPALEGASRAFGNVDYNAWAIRSILNRPTAPQVSLQTSLARSPRRICLAPFLHLAFPLLFRRHRLLRRACPQLAVPRCLRLLLPRAASSLGCARARLSRIPRRHLFSGRHRPHGSHARASFSRSCHVCLVRRHRRSSGRGHFRRDPQPCCSHCAMAHCFVSLHCELHRGAANGSVGNIFHHAGASDFFVASGNDARPHRLEPRSIPRRKKLVRGRPRCWSRHPCPAGNAVASWSRADRALVPLSRAREFEKTHGPTPLHPGWFLASACTPTPPQSTQSCTLPFPPPP